MLRKLEAHGIVGDVLKWITDWRKDRMQRVVLNSISSDWAKVVSSVIQGSVLGPVLFIISINDIDIAIKNHESKIFKYADDSKIGRPIRTQEDAAALQADIDSVWEWSKQWGMDYVSIHSRHVSYISATIIRESTIT